MTTHTSSDEDRHFRAAFEAASIQPAGFTHQAHLRLAYVYLSEYATEVAQERMRESILVFLAHHDVSPNQYHETLTRAWMMAVRHFMDRSASSCFAEFAANSQALLDGKVMLKHYRAETLFSPGARQSFVEPDLPAIHTDSCANPMAVQCSITGLKACKCAGARSNSAHVAGRTGRILWIGKIFRRALTAEKARGRLREGARSSTKR